MRRFSSYIYQTSRLKIQKIFDASFVERRQGMHTAPLEATVPANHCVLAAESGGNE